MSDSLIIHFIANYWKQLLGAILPLIVLYLIQYFSSKRQKTEDKHSQLPEEHPLAEFRDARPSEGDDLNLPVNAEDTEHIPYVHVSRTEEEMIQRSRDFYQLMNSRRSIRMFSNQSVPIEVIRNIVHTAGTSPSGLYVCVYVLGKHPRAGITFWCHHLLDNKNYFASAEIDKQVICWVHYMIP